MNIFRLVPTGSSILLESMLISAIRAAVDRAPAWSGAAAIGHLNLPARHPRWGRLSLASAIASLSRDHAGRRCWLGAFAGARNAELLRPGWPVPVPQITSPDNGEGWM